MSGRSCAFNDPSPPATNHRKFRSLPQDTRPLSGRQPKAKMQSQPHRRNAVLGQTAVLTRLAPFAHERHSARPKLLVEKTPRIPASARPHRTRSCPHRYRSAAGHNCSHWFTRERICLRNYCGRISPRRSNYRPFRHTTVLTNGPLLRSGHLAVTATPVDPNGHGLNPIPVKLSD